MESKVKKLCITQGFTLGLKGISANVFNTAVLIGGTVNTKTSVSNPT